MQFYKINICQIMIFSLYTVYNKYEMIKIGSIIASARIILPPTVGTFATFF